MSIFAPLIPFIPLFAAAGTGVSTAIQARAEERRRKKTQDAVQRAELEEKQKLSLDERRRLRVSQRQGAGRGTLLGGDEELGLTDQVGTSVTIGQ